MLKKLYLSTIVSFMIDSSPYAMESLKFSESRSTDDITTVIAVAKKHAHQVFNLSKKMATYIDTNDNKSGLGFIVNPQDGIIFTTQTLCGTSFACYITHATADGKEYKTPDIEILGGTPKRDYGNYSFLRFNEKNTPIDQSIFNKQVTMDVDITPPSSKTLISFFKYKNNKLTIGTGEIFQAYQYAYENDPLMQEHVYVASCDKFSADIGSPVFNLDGKLIGLVSHHIKNDENTIRITPIWYPYNSYQQLLVNEKISVNVLFRSTLYSTNIRERVRIFSTSLEALKDYTLDEFDQKDKLFQVNFLTKKQTPSDDNDIEVGDMILSVNGERIGTSLIKLNQAIRIGELNTVEIFRGNKKKILQMLPKKITQSFGKFIDVEGISIVKSGDNPELLYNVPNGSAIVSLKLNYFQISAINNTAISTFDDFIKELYRVVEILGKNYFYFQTKMIGCVTKNNIYNDLSQWRGKTFDVIQFDESTHKWEKVDYKDYAKGLLEG